MEKIRVGIIGSGYWGPNLIRNLSALQMSEVVGVSDLREDRLQSLRTSYPGMFLTTNYQELLNLNLDAMVIATPPVTHYQLAKESLEHDLHVLVEKPITTSSNQAEELIELANKKDRVLMVGHTYIFNNAVHELKRMMDDGVVGKILYVDTARLNLGLFQGDMNVLWDLAPHDISIINFILGSDPVSVEVYGSDCVFKGVHDVVYMSLLFPNDILAHIHVSWLDPCKVRRVTVVGSRKMVVYNDLEPLEKIKVYDKGVEVPDYPSNFGEFQCSYRYGDIVIPNLKFIEPLRQECQHFIDCIVNQTHSISSGVDGLRVVRILEAAQDCLVNSHHRQVLTW
jgi:predicted dehydrogenase